MKEIVTGIVAHVDVGKTTLSEALLYQTGSVRHLGRVDKQDTFLDPEELEKQRGITIFSHQAQLQTDELKMTLLDTPGHVDFAAQTEQVLSVLDYAILVISASSGIQGYTLTLWRLLARYHVPVFIFINKMDTTELTQADVLAQLQQTLGEGCVDFTGTAAGQLTADFYEAVALNDEAALDDYMANDQLSVGQIQQLIANRQVFPCYFGSALKMAGTAELLAGITTWSQERTSQTTEFGAQVFKISHTEKNERLTWLRVTSGSLQPKELLVDEQKVNQLRVYNGIKFTTVPEVLSGQVCAIPNLTGTFPGQGLGEQADAARPQLTPVLNYAVDLQGQDLQTCLGALRELEDEDPQLHVTWSERLQEIQVQLMGQIQLEVLTKIMADRFGLTISLTQGRILYQETITAPVEGVGHFEPLRHYAEVHLLLEPAPRGSGLSFTSDCSLEVLSSNWQHQVLANLAAKPQLGVLLGMPLTDVKVTLISGKASNVHTVGGDFRQATWRALRQGLMELRQQDQCQVLEPWYEFNLQVQADQVGRALTDIERMHGTFTAPEMGQDVQELVTITGQAPVAKMRDYTEEVRAYTHGKGQLECIFAGYRPCQDQAAVVEAGAYDPVGDLENTPDSVFCAHGAGYPVAWDEVPAMAHVEYRAE
ncbi:elongation factor G [Ligilactobacillus pabuli]|uniref:Elongation factor G n=1 Tax=Ligilactobacillus pabuli TaxID=2886039 RepID=A0ABQ5JH15_9LACO|nr:TetM/TetW/TetO/TetS family tetracycline resistance ribosomal protection protein [Ligilactobacillus pabuli]GKS81282.1 elongation factor G [Ligilactobacillus pabuli]